MSDDQNNPITGRNESTPATSQLDAFLAEIKGLTSGGTAGTRGRVIFGLDATASRQDTWDTACKLQADMFREVAAAGGLEVQLIYFRGNSQCAASRWTSDADHLRKVMTSIMCRAGETQLRKVLVHAQKETKVLKVGALIYVGDMLEESPDELIPEARELGRLGTPVFVFQEGDDRSAKPIFREIASVTKGAYCQFDAGAARQLGELLRAVAVYAVGGLTALAARRDAGAIKLLGQLK